jgi:hypothetical protein
MESQEIKYLDELLEVLELCLDPNTVSRSMDKAFDLLKSCGNHEGRIDLVDLNELTQLYVDYWSERAKGENEKAQGTMSNFIEGSMHEAIKGVRRVLNTKQPYDFHNTQ